MYCCLLCLSKWAELSVPWREVKCSNYADRTVSSSRCGVVYFACLSGRCHLSPGERPTAAARTLYQSSTQAKYQQSLRVLRTQKLKTHQLETQRSKVLPLKPAAGPYIAMHAMPTARDFLLANFYTPGPFTCIFPKTSSEFSL